MLYANKAVEEVTGYTRREIIGGNPRLWGQQMSKSFYKKFWRTIKYEKKVFEGEIKNKRKNGEIYTALARIAPVIGEKGELIGFVGVERDITKEKQVDQAKTEFVSLASHQLKNPLTVVSLYVEMLLGAKAGKVSEKQKKFLQKIKNANQKILDLINSLLNVSKIELGRFPNEPEMVNLAKVMQSVVREFKPEIEKKRIIFEANGHNNRSLISIDPKLLTMVLQNLISNAVKYTPDKGRVALETIIDKNDLRIKIADTGCGIPESEQKKVFTKLFRASNLGDDESGGTGLGLYIVKSILDQVKGRIRFESRENKGTTFYVSWPLRDGKALSSGAV